MVMVSAAFTGSVKLCVRVLVCESVTVTLKVTGPAVGGVPVKSPDELSVNQAGALVAAQL